MRVKILKIAKDDAHWPGKYLIGEEGEFKIDGRRGPWVAGELTRDNPGDRNPTVYFKTVLVKYLEPAHD